MPSLVQFTATPLAQFLLATALRATAILVAAWTLSLALSVLRRSAALRHQVWTWAICSLLGLPVLVTVLPTWQVFLPWPIAVDEDADSAPLFAEPEMALLTQGAAPADAAIAWLAVPVDSASVDDRTNTSPPPVVAAAAPVWLATGHCSWLRTIWLLGLGLTLSPTLLALASLWRLKRRSQIVTSGRLHGALAAMTSALGMRPVSLIVSHERAMPMTWGVWRPTVVLPRTAANWSAERLRMVLRHELAHLERGDCLTQLLAQLARAVYWFHPLAWVAQRELRILQELACDDLVLASGFSGPDYAEQLLAVAASCSPPRASAVALAMARTPNFERRLLAILGPDQDRRPLSRRGFQLGAFATAALVTIATVIQLHAPSVTASEPPATPPAAQSQPATTAANPDRTRLLADLRATIADQYVTPVNDQEILAGAIKGMLGALRDPYSDFLTPESIAAMERQLSGSLVGIGAQLEIRDQEIRVVTPLAGSPALQAGIRAGDFLVAVDDQPTTGAELAQVVQRITGPLGSTVRLKIRRADGQTADVSVVRGPINVPTVKGVRRGADSAWDFLLDADRKIGYVQIVHFGANTPRETRAAIESLKRRGVQGLILDLRFNPGGLLDSTTSVAQLFLNSGTIVSLHSRGQTPVTIAAEKGQQLTDLPLVLLVNSQTASAAEVLAGALQDHQRAVVLGTRTHGKGTVQSLIKLEDSVGAVKLTTSEYHLPSGRSIDKRPGQATWGVNPDNGYFVPLDRRQAKALQDQQRQRDSIRTNSDNAAIAENDPQLAAALKTLSAHIDGGAFEKVSSLSEREIGEILQRDEIEQRRESTLATLEQLDRELAAVRANKP